MPLGQVELPILVVLAFPRAPVLLVEVGHCLVVAEELACWDPLEGGFEVVLQGVGGALQVVSCR